MPFPDDEIRVISDKLQTELGDSLSKDDLVVGGSVIYQYRGKPYKAEILDMKCKLASMQFIGHYLYNRHGCIFFLFLI